jgi:hypothetical protein
MANPDRLRQMMQTVAARRDHCHWPVESFSQSGQQRPWFPVHFRGALDVQATTVLRNESCGSACHIRAGA